jgi:Fe-Mn family superoxide dismutase
MKHELPKLPFEMDALAPHMSKETLEYHYGKHHKAYVDKLNELIPGTPYENSSLEDIIKKSEGPIFNNGAQIWNHTFFWNCLRPTNKGPANTGFDGSIKDAITRDFGGLDQFKEQFTKASITLFGSGWAWLCKDQAGKLSILQCGNADNPMRHGKTPLMTLDVWEHAYYIDYRNARPKFVEAFWNLANWDFVKKNYEGK